MHALPADEVRAVAAWPNPLFRRVLLLACAVVGFWLLGLLFGTTRASAAPTSAPDGPCAAPLRSAAADLLGTLRQLSATGAAALDQPVCVADAPPSRPLDLQLRAPVAPVIDAVSAPVQPAVTAVRTATPALHTTVRAAAAAVPTLVRELARTGGATVGTLDVPLDALTHALASGRFGVPSAVLPAPESPPRHHPFGAGQATITGPPPVHGLDIVRPATGSATGAPWRQPAPGASGPSVTGDGGWYPPVPARPVVPRAPDGGADPPGTGSGSTAGFGPVDVGRSPDAAGTASGRRLIARSTFARSAVPAEPSFSPD
jgi:hypothetical protein